MLRGWETVKGVKMTEDRWRKLEVRELANDLAFEIYQVSRNFLKDKDIWHHIPASKPPVLQALLQLICFK